MKKLTVIALLATIVGNVWGAAGPEFEEPEYPSTYNAVSQLHVDRPEFEAPTHSIYIPHYQTTTLRILKETNDLNKSYEKPSSLINNSLNDATVHFDKEIEANQISGLAKHATLDYTLKPKTSIIGITINGMHKQITPFQILPDHYNTIHQNDNDYEISRELIAAEERLNQAISEQAPWEETKEQPPISSDEEFRDSSCTIS